MQDQAVVTDADVMLKIIDALDKINELTGITPEQRARVWDAIIDPRADWLGAHRVKITPLRTLGDVVQAQTGNPPSHVPTASDIIQALEAVTTPKEAPPVERSTHDPDL
jgi:hypothetical protein